MSIHKVTAIRFLTDYTFVLQFTRDEMNFRAGQRIMVGLKGEMDQRDYSVYSGENDDFLEILVREVLEGNISFKLKNCKPGDELEVNGPFGNFFPSDSDRKTKKLVFVATGTGIAPFHSMVRSFPEIDYLIMHGVRYAVESYENEQFDPKRYILCTSNEILNNRKERVTGALARLRPDPEMIFFLCGNGDMIFDAFHILREKGVSADRIFSEMYF